MLVLLLVSLVGSCLLPQIARFMGRGAGLVIALFPLGLFAAFIRMSDIVERGWVRGEGKDWAPSVGFDLTLRLDGFSFLFCLLITGIGTLVIVYAGGYLTGKPRHQRARFFTLILLFMTAMLGTVLADNLLLMVTMWEATSILSFLLIGFDSRSARARRAALMALQVTAGGGLALVAAVAMIAHVLGTFSLAQTIDRTPELVASSWAAPIIVAVMIAGFTKSAQFPFHFWLPNAMQAPTPASAFLHSATMVKLGIYLLARFEPVIAATVWGRNVMIAVACITMLVAAVQALRAESFKAALAYSTIASLGILVLLVGLDGPTATVAMIGFLIAHALYKAALFFCAGSVLHMTGQGSLRALGGLARRMPLTAIACIGASLSMAGIPPFFGFITKEFLFQAQIESSWESVPIAIAVLVNAVMVAVASVVTLRPFFLKPGAPIEFKNRESLSLGLPPLFLSLLGLFLSLNPGWIERVVVSPAVAAVYRRPIPVDVAVWHGVTPMLLLSGLVVVVGIAISVFWRRIHLFLRDSDRFERFAIERLWESSQRTLPWLSAHAVNWTEHSDLRVLLGIVLATIAGITGWSILAVGAPVRIAIGEMPHLADVAIALAAVVGAVVAARSQHLVTTMLAVGLTGFAVAILFMTGGAPDLAITQFTVEALLVVLLTAMLATLPLMAGRTRNPAQRLVDAGLAGALALVLLVATLDAAAAIHGAAASDFFGRMSYIAGRGHNVVNVILVDFRAFDTLGETAVIAAAALLGSALFFRPGDEDRPVRGDVHFGFAMAAGPLFALLLAASVAILWRGHDQPGGGFIGGLVASLAFAVLSLARGPIAAARSLRLPPTVLVGAGLLLAVASGLPGMIGGGAYLTHLWWEPGGGLPKLGTTLLFDIGVYLVVLGAVLTYLFGLQKEAVR
ncbi:NADH dehydrogenase [Sphingomonas sp. Leaf24]|uniref:hydrogen gas-evolving membrane-bound hydrogenase subunit E n=1 Tax=unclassified Sphingomonas TaxID=196159 RepID=UPI0006F1E9E7|nr:MULTISPECIES: hydrogen gas-evolving membrane-bound hydrogenase subunit E [unclassified Sphingomonas]KQM20437.1 NADH dehydrogenase [Sphingomonas sp. Leaf5]KQM92278.1 NADH dehydrogenase [Sphingomonas sp. Leaf24]